MLVAAATIGECVHVAGVFAFLDLAHQAGHGTRFLGSALTPQEIARIVRDLKPDMLGVSYRLSPDAAGALLVGLRESLKDVGMYGCLRLVFGGTPAVAQVARLAGLFEQVFDGRETTRAVVEYLRGEPMSNERSAHPPGTLVERILWKRPYPLIRHHVGLPSLESTVRAVEELAEAAILDVVSLGPDQNAQEWFFDPDRMDHRRDGAGGVPVRTPDDLRMLYQSTRRGNYPLMRCYAGTRHLVRWAQMLESTINNAWGAIPLFWYSELDRRSTRPLLGAIRENQQAIAWHGKHGIPVEVNDAHQWSLRNCSDAIAVAVAYIAGLNAKKCGVRDYVMQYMFCNPVGTAYPMDVAKMLAKRDMLDRLGQDGLRTWTMVRTGLASLSPDMDVAKGQLASSIHTAMTLVPDIVHVVAYCEANHLAEPDDVIESCKIARGVIQSCLQGLPSSTQDRAIMSRREELVAEADVILTAVGALSSKPLEDALCDPEILAGAVSSGILDAPQLQGTIPTAGRAKSRLVKGAWMSFDEAQGRPIMEAERLARLRRL